MTKGTALLIKQTNPVVVPVVISGFGVLSIKRLKFKKKGTPLSVTFKAPLKIDTMILSMLFSNN
jgi:hypothetical protein